MDTLQQSALAWKELTEYRYQFVYGYKKVLYPINLSFSFEGILEGKITFEQIQKAAQYEEMVKPRLEALVQLKNSLDNEFNLYSFMPRMYSFYTNIKADYLIASHVVIDSFVFIIHTSPDGDAKCDFLCCSTFAKGDRDYEQNQKKRVLLKKERIHIPSNITTVLLNKLDNESS